MIDKQWFLNLRYIVFVGINIAVNPVSSKYKSELIGSLIIRYPPWRDENIETTKKLKIIKQNRVLKKNNIR